MRCPRQKVFAAALATVLMLGVGGAARAACYGSDQELSAQVVSQFVNDPERLLTLFPSGGPQMISLIRDLVASDPASLPQIVKLNAEANADQLKAIGTGLGQAALLCSHTAQAFSGEILQMTVTANNQPLSQAFAAVMGDLFLSSTDSAGGGGGGGESAATTGGVGGAAVSGPTLHLTTSVPTRPADPLMFGAFLSVTPGNSGGLFTLGTAGGPDTLSKYVSPSRP
jgi:hypothetical protein